MRNDNTSLLKEKKVGFIIKERMNGAIDISMRDFWKIMKHIGAHLC